MEKDNMDIKTEQELRRIENHLTGIFSKLITEGFKEIKESITELFNKDIEYMKETQKRFSGHHNEHFLNDKQRSEEITRVKESISDKVHLIVDDKFELLDSRISNISNTQIKCQASHSTEDKLDEKNDRKRELTNSQIGLIVAVCSLVSGVIVYFIK